MSNGNAIIKVSVRPLPLSKREGGSANFIPRLIDKMRKALYNTFKLRQKSAKQRHLSQRGVPFMKKLLSALCAALTVVVLAVSLSACANALEGKRYIFSEIRVEYADGITQEQRDRLDLIAEANEAIYYNTTLEFFSDGTANVGGRTVEYVIDGDSVTLGGVDSFGSSYLISGNELISTSTSLFGTMTLIYERL